MECFCLAPSTGSIKRVEAHRFEASLRNRTSLPSVYVFLRLKLQSIPKIKFETEIGFYLDQNSDENRSLSNKGYSGQKAKHPNCEIRHSGSQMPFCPYCCSQTAVSNAADVVMLPEIWNSPYSNDSFPVYCEPIPSIGENANAKDSPSFEMMQSVAKENGIYLVGGSIPETHQGNLYNTCCVFNRSGTFVAKHRFPIHCYLSNQAFLEKSICSISTFQARSLSKNRKR